MAGAPYCVHVRYWLRWSPQAYASVLTATGRRPRPARPRPVTTGETAFPSPRFTPWLVVAFAALLVALGSELAGRFGLREPEDFSREAALSLFQPLPLRYDLWYRADLRHLGTLSRLPAPEGRARLLEELQALRRELLRLDREGYVHPRGFRVYSPSTTGRLHALALAQANRRTLLDGAPPARLPGPEAVHTFGGYRLYRSLPRKFAPEDAVVRALAGLRLPDSALAGYRVYLLPGSLGNVSGFGGHGYAMLGGEPLTERLVEHQAASTVTHEFGHHLSLSRLGGHLADSPAEWERYLELRGIPAWRDDGAVNSEAWRLSPEEALAEDVRVLFGTPEAASLPFDAGYGDPRDNPGLRREVERFLHQLAARQERYPADPGPAPWLDDVGAGIRAGSQPEPGPLPRVTPRRLLLAFLLATTAAGWASSSGWSPGRRTSPARSK